MEKEVGIEWGGSFCLARATALTFFLVPFTLLVGKLVNRVLFREEKVWKERKELETQAKI